MHFGCKIQLCIVLVFIVNLSISSKGFEEAKERLEELYAKCDCLMADNAESSLITATIPLMNNVFAEMERLVIRENFENSKELQTPLK